MSKYGSVSTQGSTAVLAKQFRLADGRLLGYAEYGDPSGKPIFHFHGWLSSRLEFGPIHDVAQSLGARVISIDRPGCGLSALRPGRIILDWPDDVAELADSLGIDRFAVSGWSFGGPYVAACAYKIPHRLTAAGMIAGIATLNHPAATRGMIGAGRIILWLGSKAPWLLKPIVWKISRMLRSSPQKFVKEMLSALPEADRVVLSEPEFRNGLLDGMREMFRSGDSGAYQDGVTFVRPWGFRAQDIQMKVHVWHGDADRNVPMQMGEYYGRAIPNCAITVYPGEGHFILFSHAEEILRTLIA